MKKRAIRMGIDVGGTHTKAVAIDSATNEIVGIANVMTSHNHPAGVAAGVVESFQKCLKDNDIHPEEIIFIAHSTTQATNALLEGDVAEVGVLAMGKGGLEGLLAKKQSRLEDIDLGTGRQIKMHHQYLKTKAASPQALESAVNALLAEGAGVIVASMAFGVDDNTLEHTVFEIANKKGIPVSMASEISKLYGLTRRTRTAAINGSILPKMLDTATSTEESIRQAGISVPLMIMRGDGGVMSISEMKKRPVLTMLSGPAASVVGALMYLRASNGIYFEVGGTSTNIGIIKDGRPAVDYTVLGGHPTFVNSLDVRVLGVAGGSMVRAANHQLLDVGPRSAHIGGLSYAVYTPEEEIEEPQLEFFSPKEGDPADYVRILLKNGNRIAITNSCAANVLGLVSPQYFSYGNAEAARRAMQPLADYLGITVEETARRILSKACDKIEPVVNALADKYHIDKHEIDLVGVGGGAASLIPFTAERMNLRYKIPQNAEVISSIGVALAMVRDVVERVLPNPSQEDIASLKKEASDLAIQNGAVPDTVEVQIEIDAKTSKITAIALGSTEVQTTDLSTCCSVEEAKALAAESAHTPAEQVRLAEENGFFYAFSAPGRGKWIGTDALRLIDKKGFIRVQRSSAEVCRCTVQEAPQTVARLFDRLTIYVSDGLLIPDIYLCLKGKLLNYSNMLNLEQVLTVMSTELITEAPEQDILLIGARNETQ